MGAGCFSGAGDVAMNQSERERQTQVCKTHRVRHSPFRWGCVQSQVSRGRPGDSAGSRAVGRASGRPRGSPFGEKNELGEDPQ